MEDHAENDGYDVPGQEETGEEGNASLQSIQADAKGQPRPTVTETHAGWQCAQI